MLQVRVEGLEELVERVVSEKVAEALINHRTDEWLDSTQAAEYLGIARSTLHDLVSVGKLPRVGDRKTKIMLRRSMLDEYLASRGRA